MLYGLIGGWVLYIDLMYFKVNVNKNCYQKIDVDVIVLEYWNQFEEVVEED